MVRKAHQQEELLNGELARLLSGFEIPAEPEFGESGRRMDVVAEVDGLRVVLEAETGFHRKSQAVRDADARLKQGLTVVVFAVCYPEGASVASLGDANLTWTVRTRADAPAEAWAIGGISQLAQAVRQIPASLSGADKAAQVLSDGLDATVQRLSTPMRRALAQALDLPRTKRKSGPRDDGYFTAAKRGMLVVATAMLFHHRLQGYLPEEPPAGFEGAWPPASAKACAEEQGAVMSEYSDAWRAILAVDYKPVFMTGRVALRALPSQPDTAQAIHNLASVVEQVATYVHGLRHDLLGRIFHRVLDTARYDGSYYTSTAAAVLLAALALREEDADWSDPNAIANMRICDPACGTGTLLMAAAERIRDLRHAAGPIGEEDDEALALLLVEDMLWGYDSNLTATHMAASTLGMLSPRTQFGRMRVFRALLGVYDGVAYLGSLEFLNGGPRLAAWPAMTQQVEDDQPDEPPPPMDVVIMNPPFTRDSLRHDQFTRAEEEQIKRREKQMLEGKGHRAAARLHSSGGMFAVLGEHMLSDTGTLALVLPTVVATTPGNLALRQYLASRFHVDLIVSSHDPDRIFFSENTSIGEMLLVCRRWNNGSPKPPTRFVNLTRNPATPVEALDTAVRIDRSAELGGAAQGNGRFTEQRIDAKRIAQGDWNAVNFLSPYLVDAYRTLVDSSLTLSEIAEVGPEGRRVRDSYRRSALPDTSGRRALWQHETDSIRSMRAEPDSYIEPLPPKRHLADRYWEQRSRLLLPHRLWLPLTRVGAVALPEPAVGSIWAPCRPYDPTVIEIICLYLNSSIGILAMLGGRGNRKPSYPSFSIDALRSIPVPDFAALGTDAREAMAKAFEELQSETLQPLPHMSEDPVRKRIDDAVAAALGFDLEWMASIRRALSEEPSVANRRYGV